MTPFDRTCPQRPGHGYHAVKMRVCEDTMKLTVYGDFNCPYSYLASQPSSARTGSCGPALTGSAT